MRPVPFTVFCVTILVTCANIAAMAQSGKYFPSIQGETLDNKLITIPDDTNGKFTLVGMAYSKKSEDELQTWFSPIFNTFINKPEKSGLFDSFMYDVNVYFIPMFTGVKIAASGAARKKALKGTDPRLFPYILFYKGELKKYKEELDFDKKDQPYFFVIDREGKIVYATSGAFSKDKLGAIEELME